ncbi:MAG: ribosome silencing factor [Verrucomicrobiota bacterium]|jgi:ribosome-associated protein
MMDRFLPVAAEKRRLDRIFWFSLRKRVANHADDRIGCTSKMMAIEGEELARACVKAAAEMQAENIRVWDMRGVSNLTDFMIVCSGTSMPHLRAIIRDVAGIVDKGHHVKPVHSEGKADSRWVVLDYIDVMMHVMDEEMREFYGLETLWADAKELPWDGTGQANGGQRTSRFTH